MIADALKTGSPTLRSELWTWLAEKLPKRNVTIKQINVVFLYFLFFSEICT